MTLEIATPRWCLPLLTPKRYKGAKGGRGSGKSNLFAELVVEEMIANKDYSVVCIREIQKSLKYSAKKLIEDKIRALNVQHLFEITLTEIRRIGGKGIILFLGMQDHTSDSIKSLEGFNVAWVEEAQSMSERSIELLLPTIRAEGSEVWFSWNPTNENDPVEQFFKTESDDKTLVHVNYTDNPFLPQTLQDEADRHKREKPQTFNHVWLGDYITFGEVFTRDMFRKSSWKPQIKQLDIYIAVDVAMSLEEGADRSSICIVGKDTGDTIYVIEQQAGRWDSHSFKQRILDACEKYPTAIVGIEKTTSSWHFIESFREMMRVRNVFAPFVELKPAGRSKQKRIESYLLSSIQQGRLLFMDEPSETFINEAINFPKGAHDDELDAITYAIEMCFSRSSAGGLSEDLYDEEIKHSGVF